MSESRNYGRSVWLLLPLVTLLCFGAAVFLPFLILRLFPAWVQLTYFIAFMCVAVLAPYRYQGARQSLKLFSLGAGVTIVCQVFWGIFKLSGWWLLPVLAVSPGSLLFWNIGLGPRTMSEYMLESGCFALANGIAYANFPVLVGRFVPLGPSSPSSKFPPWPFRRGA